MESAAVSGMAKCSSSAILPCMVPPLRRFETPAGRASISILIRAADALRHAFHIAGTLLATSPPECAPCPNSGQTAPCLSRDRRKRQTRTDEHAPELHAGSAAANRPDAAHVVGAVARDVLRRDPF